MAKRFERRLRALKYPDWAQFDIRSIDRIKDLVFFLENSKIRDMNEGDRVSIQAYKNGKKTNNDKWFSAFQAYLASMQTCGLDLSGMKSLTHMCDSDWVEVIDWLVSQAVLVAFEDNRFEYNKNKPIRRIKTKQYKLTHCDTQECHEGLEKLCKLLKVPAYRGEDGSPNNVITSESLYTLIAYKFNTVALANYEASLRSKDDSKQKTDRHEIEDQFDKVKDYRDILHFYGNYEGFQTGDEKVDAATIILKILYILDLRGLQNQLNEIVTFIQRFTANPRTNTRLGKVGY